MKISNQSQFGSRVIVGIASFTAGLLAFAFLHHFSSSKTEDPKVHSSSVVEKREHRSQKKKDPVAARPGKKQKSVAQAPKRTLVKKSKLRSRSFDGDQLAKMTDEAFRSIDADLESESASESQAIAEELRLSKGQLQTIMTKQSRLLVKIQKAEERGSVYLKKLLIRDHLAWAREYLGPDRYPRYADYTHRYLAQHN